MRELDLDIRARQESANLTPSDILTVSYLMLGLTDETIAKRLKISRKGVYERIQKVFFKMRIEENFRIGQTSEFRIYNRRCRLIFECLKKRLLDIEEVALLGEQTNEWISKNL